MRSASYKGRVIVIDIAIVYLILTRKVVNEIFVFPLIEYGTSFCSVNKTLRLCGDIISGGAVKAAHYFMEIAICKFTRAIYANIFHSRNKVRNKVNRGQN